MECTLKDYAEIIGATLLLSTFIKGLFEYTRQVTHRRVQLFLELERSFRKSAKFQEIRELINRAQSDDKESDRRALRKKLQAIPRKTRRDYAAFFEIIAFLINSDLLDKNAACYMFSGDAWLCWNNADFWTGFKKTDENWGVLHKFVQEMQELHSKQKPYKDRYSL